MFTRRQCNGFNKHFPSILTICFSICTYIWSCHSWKTRLATWCWCRKIPELSGLLLVPWLLLVPCHQRAWFWACRINRSLAAVGKVFKLSYLNIWYMQNTFMILLLTLPFCILTCKIHQLPTMPNWETWASFCQHGSTLIPALISKHMPSKVRDEITYPSPKLQTLGLANGWLIWSTFYNGCYDFSMLGLKLDNVSKMSFRTMILKCGPTFRKQMVNPRNQIPQGYSVEQPELPIYFILLENVNLIQQWQHFQSTSIDTNDIATAIFAWMHFLISRSTIWKHYPSYQTAH